MGDRNLRNVARGPTPDGSTPPLGAKPRTLEELVAACDQFDRLQAKQINAEWVAQFRHHEAPLTLSQGLDALSRLRRNRYLDELILLADSMLEAGLEAPKVRRLYAQGLIDTGRYAPAEAMLENVLTNTADAGEQVECCGLLGRIQKQKYVNARGDKSVERQKNLINAVHAYYDVYRRHPQDRTWHGINASALMARAERDGVRVTGVPSSTELAQAVLDTLKRRQSTQGKLDNWDLATTVEAYVATKQWDRALAFAKTYTDSPDVAAFELGSTLRQFEEVWQLKDDGQQSGMLLMLLRTALLRRDQSGGAVVLSGESLASAKAPPVSEEHLEKVFGSDKYQPLAWYRQGLLRCSAVGQIETANERKYGTGFIVNSKDLGLKVDDEFVLVTNEHVISDDENNSSALRPDGAWVRFEAWDKAAGQRYRVKKLLWKSPISNLDATIVALDPPLKDCQSCGEFGPCPTVDGKNRVYMIGYPLGGGLAISLNDNLLVGARDPRIHYRTPSDPGSSGSPVFDNEWRLVGLHHAGSATMNRLDGGGIYEANEGISILAIRSAASGGKFALPATIVPAAAPKSKSVPLQSTASDDPQPLIDGPPPAAPMVRKASTAIFDRSHLQRLFGKLLREGDDSGKKKTSSDKPAHDGTTESIRESIAAHFSDEMKRKAVLKQLEVALRKLKEEADEHEPGVFFSPTDGLASLLQSSIADTAAKPRTTESILEFTFDKDDTSQVLDDFFKKNKVIKRHDLVRPTNAAPATLAEDAKLFLVSDFGTGLYGAPVISQTIVESKESFDVLMHLGDVYYSGQPAEVQQRLLNIWPKVPGAISRTLNGNHDMYSGGWGYFDVALQAFDQPSSYFALQNKNWTLICLDTAYVDNDLDDDQIEWIKETIKQAQDRGIVLLSHHPLFSNFKSPGDKLEKRLKKHLKNQRITTWYWGHEHHCVIYDQHPDYGFFGRCLGHGGMPAKRKDFKGMATCCQLGDFAWLVEEAGESVPRARYLDGPNPYIVGHEDKYCPHGYFTLEFSDRELRERCHLAEGQVLHEMTFAARSAEDD